jgi:hypothetical protein
MILREFQVWRKFETRNPSPAWLVLQGRADEALNKPEIQKSKTAWFIITRQSGDHLDPVSDLGISASDLFRISTSRVLQGSATPGMVFDDLVS